MLKKPRGKDQMNIDRISNLPLDVLDSILVHMPLREAVRMSVLSTKWRHHWTRLSQILINDKIFPGAMLDGVARWREIEKILRQVQLNNTGSRIEKFKLSAYCRPDHSVLLQWVDFLRGKGLKEFILQAIVSPKRFKFPLNTFSCQQLNYLELYSCALDLPDSSAFEGFSSLISLKLTSVCIGPSTLECLVHRCPVLESLILIQLDYSILLKLHNTKLRYLKILSAFDDIYLMDNPLLATVDIRMKVPTKLNVRHEDSNLVRIIGCLQGVKRLVLTDEFIEFLAKRDVPEKLPSMLENLTVLKLREVRAGNLKHWRVSLCLLKSAPNLEELYISVGKSLSFLKSVVDFLKAEISIGLYLNRLKMVKFNGIWDCSLAPNFCKLILANSPMLETLTLIHYDGLRIPDELFTKFQRASEHVKIITLVSSC